MQNSSNSNKSIPTLPNLGPKSGALLARIGIICLEDLRAMGCVEAYCLLKAQGEPVSLNLLWAMYGALNGIKWTQISVETKADLRAQVDAFRFD